MRRALLAGLFCLATPLLGAQSGSLNGFRIEGARVPAQDIRSGGPDRDGLPVVDEPRHVAPEEATWVAPGTPVIGVSLGGEARAYPVHVMEYHQLVNDQVGGIPVVVTYDPLTATSRAYRRRWEGDTLDFGISGLVYNSGFLLYDRKTESLWSQFRGDAIAGPLAGRRLARIPVRQETMAGWRTREPGTRVLVRPEPRKIDYRYSPYKAYWLEDGTPFPVAAEDRRFHAKEVVLGVEVQGKTRAYLGSLVTAADLEVEDEFQGRRLRIRYQPEEAVFVWEAPDDVLVTDAYWFAWKAFHPDTEIWNEPSLPKH